MLKITLTVSQVAKLKIQYSVKNKNIEHTNIVWNYKKSGFVVINFDV